MWWSTLTGRLEQAKVLDPVVDGATRAVGWVLPRGPVKDALHGRWLGHPLHPLLVALPIGMWSGASLLDLSGGAGSSAAARRLVGAGVLLVAPSAASGLADWSELGVARRPRRVGLVHAAANTATALLYGASWLVRGRGEQARGRDLALLGAATMMVGGYLGGHLAYSEGVGVNRNADEPRKPLDWADATAAGALGDSPLRVEVDGQAVVLCRTPEGVQAMGATCSHLGGPLDQGEVQAGCLVCPWHGSRFRLRDGSVAQGPATVPQRSYDVRASGDRLQIKVRR